MADTSYTSKLASGVATAALVAAGAFALAPAHAVEAPAPTPTAAATAPATDPTPAPTAEAPSTTISGTFHTGAGHPIVFGKVVFPADTAQPAGAVVSADGLTLTVPGEGVWTLVSSAGFTFTPEATFQGTPQPVIFSGTGISGAVKTVNYTLTVTGLIAEVAEAEPTVAPAEPTVAPAEPTAAPSEPTVAPAEPTVTPVETAQPVDAPAPGGTPAPGKETPADPGTGTEVKAEAKDGAFVLSTEQKPAEEKKAEEKKADPKPEAKKEETKELAKTGASPLFLAGCGAALLVAGFFALRRRSA